MGEESMEHVEYVLGRLEELSSDEETEESQFLTAFLNQRELQSAVEMFDLLTALRPSVQRVDTLKALRSVLATIDQLTEEVDEAAELHEILVSPHVRALLECCDDVSNDRFTPELDPLPDSPSLMRPVQAHRVQLSAANSEMTLTSDSTNPVRGEHQEMYKTVALRKAPDETLGITVVRHEYAEGTQVRSAIVVERILAGSVIDRQGMVRVGDIILEVNGQPIDTPEALQRMMRQSAVGQSATISLKVMPMGARPPQMERKTFMKAYFSYVPTKDSLIPCRDAGLSFDFGDILEMVNQDDPHWWQARHLDTDGPHAGLVPSQTLEERRKAFRPMPDTIQNYNVLSCGPFGRKSSKKKNVHVFRARDAPTCFQDSDIWIYEEVRQIAPARPPVLILIGAKGVGRRAIKRLLCRQWPEEFAQPVVWTTRPMSSDPEEMSLYRHVDREEMEACAREGGMLEWGKDGADYYGVSFDAVREVIRKGRVAVLDCQPQAVRLLRTAEFQPYVVFLAVPAVDVQKTMYNKGLQSGATRQIKTEDSFRRSMDDSCHLERAYRHLFDFMMLCDDIPRASKSIANNFFDVSTKPRWVPVHWALEEEAMRAETASQQSNGSMPVGRKLDLFGGPMAATARGPTSELSYQSSSAAQQMAPRDASYGYGSVTDGQPMPARRPPSVHSYQSSTAGQPMPARGPPSVHSYQSSTAGQPMPARGPPSEQSYQSSTSGQPMPARGPPSVHSYQSSTIQQFAVEEHSSVRSYGSRGAPSVASSSGVVTPVPQPSSNGRAQMAKAEDDSSTDFDTSSDSEDEALPRRVVLSPA